MAVKINKKIRERLMKNPKLAKRFLGKDVETPKEEAVVETPAEPTEPETTDEPVSTEEEAPTEPDVPADDSGDTVVETTEEENPLEAELDQVEEPVEEVKNYSKMNKAQLLVELPALGITIDQMAGKTKAQLLELVK